MSAKADAGQTVLIIEDDELIRRAMQMVLEWEGYRVNCANNGQEALDYLRAGARPSVILLDVMMPVLDGEQFRRQQLSDPALAPIPVIVVSAVSFATAVDGAYHVRKPFEIQELLSALREHGHQPTIPPAG